MSVSALRDVSSPPDEALDQDRGLSQRGFTRLLEWLDNGADSNGQTYLEMRRRLKSYFVRRGRPFADDLADETLARVSKTLEQDGTIEVTPQARFCYAIARFVLLEDIRREHRHVQPAVDTRTGTEVWDGRRAELLQAESGASHELKLEHLDRCLQLLTPEQRDLIVEYYRDMGQTKIARRRGMAKRLGISMNALCVRASRIRTALESRMRDERSSA